MQAKVASIVKAQSVKIHVSLISFGQFLFIKAFNERIQSSMAIVSRAMSCEIQLDINLASEVYFDVARACLT